MRFLKKMLRKRKDKEYRKNTSWLTLSSGMIVFLVVSVFSKLTITNLKKIRCDETLKNHASTFVDFLITNLLVTTQDYLS
jgi:competence protein ComGC